MRSRQMSKLNTTHENYMCLFPVYLNVNFEIDYGPSIFHGGFWIFFTGLVLFSLMARNTFAQEIGKF